MTDTRAGGQTSRLNGPLLAIRDLEVRRGKRSVLQVSDLAIQRGEHLGVWGPNGAGKSTLLQAAALLIQPIRGEIWFAGERVDNCRDPVPPRRRMASLFQEPLLFDTSVTGNIEAGLTIRGIGVAEKRRRVTHWVERLGLDALRDRPARSLSGGEAHRVSLARALVLEPDLLLLDEPFGSLDYATHQRLLEDLPALLREAGSTAIIVSHDPRDLAAVAERAIALAGGRLVGEGRPAELTRQRNAARMVG